MNDPPAPDLGAIRRRLEAIGVTGDWWLHDMELTRSDIATFLAAYDAQAAQLVDAERRASVVVGWCLECEQYARLLVCCQECQDAQAARLAAQQPVVDAVLKLSTYSRETVDAGVQRIIEALGDYEDWLVAAGATGAGEPS